MTNKYPEILTLKTAPYCGACGFLLTTPNAKCNYERHVLVTEIEAGRARIAELEANEAKAVAGERARIVEWLRFDLDELWRRINDPQLTDTAHLIAQAKRDALASRADMIEAGKHHK